MSELYELGIKGTRWVASRPVTVRDGDGFRLPETVRRTWLCHNCKNSVGEGKLSMNLLNFAMDFRVKIRYTTRWKVFWEKGNFNFVGR